MFYPESEQKIIEVGGNINDKDVGVKISGTVENVLVDISEMRERNRRVHEIHDSGIVYEETETAEFQGTIESRNGKDVSSEAIHFNAFTTLSGMRVSKPETVEIVTFLQQTTPMEMFFLKIVKNDDLTKYKCFNVIQIFDEDIEDILYIKN